MSDFFGLPRSINLAASHYFSLIDMTKEEMTEPPLTMGMTDEQLMALIQGNSRVPNAIPCPSENVERTVADVTQASLVAIGYEKRQEKLLTPFWSGSMVPTSA